MSRERFSTQVELDLQARVRAAVRGVRTATGRDYTLAQLVEDALARHCDDLQVTYNDGQEWPDSRSLTAGRPLRT